MNITVVGPHPDDQELAMGGTIGLLVAGGHHVTLVDMTTGEPTPFGSEEVRAKEAAQAAGVLGVRRVQAGFKNREVVYSRGSPAPHGGAVPGTAPGHPVFALSARCPSGPHRRHPHRRGRPI